MSDRSGHEPGAGPDGPGGAAAPSIGPVGATPVAGTDASEEGFGPPLDIPELPPGRSLQLPGGRTFVREDGAEDRSRPTLLLLHGWMATADLNWFPAYRPLLDAGYHVVALDQRGHGRGVRSPERFSLAACAEDAAAVAAQVGPGPGVAVGYSRGARDAQLLGRHHRRVGAGLVLCATSRNFRGGPGDRLYFGAWTGLAAVARMASGPLREQAYARILANRLGTMDLTPWAAAEVARHDIRSLLEAGASIGTFTSHDWIGEVDVPTAVLVTARDTKIPPSRQRKLAAAVPGARVYEVDGEHQVCPRQPGRFLPALLAACEAVTTASRSEPRSDG